jgi:hypothetical protein
MKANRSTQNSPTKAPNNNSLIELSGDSFLTNLSGSAGSLHDQIMKEREERKNLEA